MAIQTGVGVKLAYKVESALGTLPGQSGGAFLRRVGSTLMLRKDTFQSAEIRSDYQIADFRHGSRRVEGELTGEISACGGTILGHTALFEACLRKDFAATTAHSAVNIGFDNSTKVVSRASGSWITDGYKVGDVVRPTGAPAGANLNKNFRITAITALNLTVDPAPTTVTATAGITVTVTGKKSFIPTTSHTAKSFTFEEQFTDISFSQAFTGCRVGRLAMSMPATGMATYSLGVMGTGAQNFHGSSSPTYPYFTSVTAARTGTVMAATQGALLVGGTAFSIVTGAEITLDHSLSMTPVIGSVNSPDVFYGRANVTGRITALLENRTLLDYFLNEDEVALHLYMEQAGSTDPKDFFSVFLPRIKFGGGEIAAQGEQGQIITLPFQALLKPTTSGFDDTTMTIQDSTIT